MINKKITKLSCDHNLFNHASPLYAKSLKKNAYPVNTRYDKPTPEGSNNHEQVCKSKEKRKYFI